MFFQKAAQNGFSFKEYVGTNHQNEIGTSPQLSESSLT
jgi:hypothetical protein